MATTRDLTETAPPATDETITCQGERFRLYLTDEAIQSRLQEIGTAISEEYEGRTPILVSVLNGAFMVTADLMRYITIDCEIDFMKLSSYGDEKVSSGNVTELKRIDANLQGRDVIVIEDIVDTGLSMQFILKKMQAHNPASLRTVTLLHKPTSNDTDVTLDYVGFDIPDLFVIGYGLDYGQIARNLPHIYILDEE
ncbi:MAG: hypoxanthine phosphoribosyltransferase [Longimonas sp.]|uniref:hypoxanthine phosphoribosyltransferase n=1 Tax=Longimonas sp. TaxID=2039626 RepID=UPI00335D0C49